MHAFNLLLFGRSEKRRIRALDPHRSGRGSILPLFQFSAAMAGKKKGKINNLSMLFLAA